MRCWRCSGRSICCRRTPKPTPTSGAELNARGQWQAALASLRQALQLAVAQRGCAGRRRQCPAPPRRAARGGEALCLGAAGRPEACRCPPQSRRCTARPRAAGRGRAQLRPGGRAQRRSIRRRWPASPTRCARTVSSMRRSSAAGARCAIDARRTAGAQQRRGDPRRPRRAGAGDRRTSAPLSRRARATPRRSAIWAPRCGRRGCGTRRSMPSGRRRRSLPATPTVSAPSGTRCCSCVARPRLSERFRRALRPGSRAHARAARPGGRVARARAARGGRGGSARRPWRASRPTPPALALLGELAVRPRRLRAGAAAVHAGPRGRSEVRDGLRRHRRARPHDRRRPGLAARRPGAGRVRRRPGRGAAGALRARQVFRRRRRSRAGLRQLPRCERARAAAVPAL